MPRQLRLEYEGAVYHVMARGNRRESIYRDDRDRLAWLDYLSQACQRTGWRVYGSVLVGNHYQDNAAGRRGFFGTPGAEGARGIR